MTVTGCSQLVGWTADRGEGVVGCANAQDLGLSTGAATFDLSRSSSNISIEAYVYGAPQRRCNFCTDVIIRAQDSVDPEVWRAVASTVSIEMSSPGTRSGPRATVTLTDVVLRNSAGTAVKISRPVRLSAICGSRVRMTRDMRRELRSVAQPVHTTTGRSGRRGARPRHGRVVRHRRLRARPDTWTIHIRTGEARCGDGRQATHDKVARLVSGFGEFIRRAESPYAGPNAQAQWAAYVMDKYVVGACRRFSTQRR